MYKSCSSLSIAFLLLGFTVAQASVIEVSFDRELAVINHGAKELSPATGPKAITRGDVIVIGGYVYPEGTWGDCIDPLTGVMCGAEPGGGPSFPEAIIGELLCTGYFFANPFQFFQPPPDGPQLGEEVGIFFLNIKFDEDNMLELRGRTLTGLEGIGTHPAKFSALGGSGMFKNAKGDALEIMIAPNTSGAFNFRIDLGGLIGVNMSELNDLIDGI